MTRPLGHRPALDGIRAVAISAVMGLHIIDRLFRGGFLGVDVFFVLSAFLISSLVLHEVADTGGHYRFGAFYARRARRLVPALVLWLALLAAPTAFVAGQGRIIAPSTAASLFYVGDFALGGILHVQVAEAYAHVWSLSIEEQFYLVWPALLVAMSHWRPPIRRTALVVGVFAAIGIFVITQRSISGNYFLPTGHLIPIAAGCLAADIYFYGAPRVVESVIESPIVGVGSLAVLAGLVAGYAYLRSELLAIAMTSLAAVLLVLHASVTTSSPTRLLSNRGMVWLGKRSYGLYLYHRNLPTLFAALIPGMRLRYAGPFVVVTSVALAAASYRFVERPVIERGL